MGAKDGNLPSHFFHVENTLQHTSVMAAKGVSLISPIYYAAGDSNMTNC